MNRDLLIALALSLATVIATVEMMQDKRLTDGVEGVFPAFARHQLNEVMSIVKQHGTKIEKQEAEQATKLLSKISQRFSFDGETLGKIRSAARLILDTARRRERTLFIAEKRSQLIAEIALIDPRPITGTPSLDGLNAILLDARHRMRVLNQCQYLARSCTGLIAEYRALGPFMHGDAMFPIVSSEVGDLTPTDELIARRVKLIAYEASLREKVRTRRETVANAPRSSSRIRAA